MDWSTSAKGPVVITHSPELTRAIRDRFAHVESCPFQGPRVFFENAGGALTLKSVVETSATFAAIPDNQGRDNANDANRRQQGVSKCMYQNDRAFGQSLGSGGLYIVGPEHFQEIGSGHAVIG